MNNNKCLFSYLYIYICMYIFNYISDISLGKAAFYWNKYFAIFYRSFVSTLKNLT